MNYPVQSDETNIPGTTMIDGALSAMSLHDLIAAAKHLEKTAILVADASALTDCASDLLSKFENAICAYRPHNMAETAMKARFVLESQVDDEGDLLPIFLQSLIDAAEGSA
ncbi:hypothetical protein [Mesorhizobium sp. A556]